MGVNHTIKDDIFTLTIGGDFSAPTFFDALERGMADPRFKAPMRALFDARDADEKDILATEKDQKRAYAEISHCFIPHWAIVASCDVVLFNVARMICMFTDLRGVDMRAYADMDEARSRLTWSNFYQQDPFCRIQSAACRPRFVRLPGDSDATQST